MLDLTREEYLKYLNAQLVPKEEEEKAKVVSKNCKSCLELGVK